MARVEKAIEIGRPVGVVYEHLTGLEGVEITDRVAEKAVAWRRLDDQGEDVWRASLISLSPKRTRLDLALEHDPTGLLDRAVDAFGGLDRQLDDELARLKSDVEAAADPPD